MERNEFYIGWMPKAPASFVQWIRRYLLMILPVIIVLAVLLALSQKKFGTGNFEFGKLTEVKGIYFNKPVPNIKVVNGKDIWGDENFITVPLIGFGKHGADGTIAGIEKEKNISLDGKEVTLKGTLLYNDGKLLMQVDANDQPLINVAETKMNTSDLLRSKELGMLDIKGEIVDPKCFFGVMKPGEGKPHKDCAMRCILGGIPPVLKVTGENGNRNYYLIVGPHGEKMNEAIQDFVAVPVELHAKAVQYGDWIVLYTNADNGITEISRSTIFQPAGSIMACAAPGCK